MAGNRRAKAFQCPSCGSPQEIVALGHTKTYACPACSAIIDMSTPEFEVVVKAQQAGGTPGIKLGTRGVIGGHLFEVIGFTIKSDGQGIYYWREYLLFNPYHGFRWLVESDGHWSFGTPIKQTPKIHRASSGVVADLAGDTYKQFVFGSAKVSFILGEFYWECRAGDRAQVQDFVNPPLMLSLEKTDEEENWTLLEYQDVAVVEKAFGITTYPMGVAPNQVNPYKSKLGEYAMASLLGLTILLVGEFGIGFIQRNEKVYLGSETFTSTDAVKVHVIPNLEIKGRTSNIEIRSAAPVSNSWVYLDYELTNLESGDSYGGSSEISYYSGSDSDGPWTEGSHNAVALIPAVPSGRYSLTIEPELPPGSSSTCEISLFRDVPRYSNMMISGFLLLISPLFILLKSASFEAKRWGNDDSSDDGDD